MSAIAKIGLQYSKDPYALDNFEEMNKYGVRLATWLRLTDRIG